MNKPLSIAFQNESITLSIHDILPTKVIPDTIEKTKKYQQILSSIKAIGLVELPMVYHDVQNKHYILLDGHLRLRALKALGTKNVECLVSKDDEAFTYNRYINRLAPIQEHKMILKAVEKGVSEEAIAEALNLNVSSINRKKHLLRGICPEAAELLQDKMVPYGVFDVLRKMKSMRQIEVSQIMIGANCFTAPYAKTFLAGTPKEQLVNPSAPKKIKGLSEEQILRMEQEMVRLQKEHEEVAANYSDDMYHLTLMKAYIRNLLEKEEIQTYLKTNHQATLQEFEAIASLENI